MFNCHFVLYDMTDNQWQQSEGAMFIKTTKSKGYEYLYLVEEIVENGRKKLVTLERLGRTDLLLTLHSSLDDA